MFPFWGNSDADRVKNYIEYDNDGDIDGDGIEDELGLWSADDETGEIEDE